MSGALSDSDGGASAADERTRALSRLDLFGGPGRLDLAKLAGELTECSFARERRSWLRAIRRTPSTIDSTIPTAEKNVPPIWNHNNRI